ncbi:MAG: hypothetical protein KDC54_22100 [Lewinella sp.]|nr:hypothetical protein [Lewinella sp.]
MTVKKTDGPLLFWLRWATIFVFLGRAWQHLYWDAPFRALLWDESMMSGLVSGLGWSWSDWVTSATVNANIDLAVRGFGVLYVVAAAAAYLLQPGRRWASVVLWLGTLGLVFLSFLYTKEKFYHLGQFFEYSLQFGSPLLLLWLNGLRRVSLPLEWAIRLAIALTFTCHGLYAFGFYPRPVNFTSMVMDGLWLSQENAIILLEIAGTLDFIVAFFLLLPWRPGARVALAYCVIWGGLTAFARIWSYLWVSPLDTVLLQWVHESVYRWPHFLVPLGALLAGLPLPRRRS